MWNGSASAHEQRSLFGNPSDGDSRGRSLAPAAACGSIVDDGTAEPFEALIRTATAFLDARRTLTKRDLHAMAERAFGGTRAAGRYTSRDAFDALEAAIVVHVRTVVPTLGGDSPELVLAYLTSLLDRLPVQSERTLEQRLFQQFSSPPTLAYLAGRALAPRPGELVLEPSAGTGALAVWAELAGARVIVNEIAPRRREILALLGFEPRGVDAEFVDDLLPRDIRPSAILMNPPFSATGGRVRTNKSEFGARHIEQALRRLSPGGRLVSIVGEGFGRYAPSVLRWWRLIATRFVLLANIALPDGAYTKFGTTHGTHIIVLERPEPGSVPPACAVETWGWRETRSLDDVLTAIGELPARRPALAIAPKAEPAAVLRPGPRRASPAAAVVPRAVPLPLTPDAVDPLDAQVDDTLPETGPFVRYTPWPFPGAQAHPARLVETISMASVQPPEPTYVPDLPSYVLADGCLSAVQVERVVYAGRRHATMLPSGERAGYLLGDGTGVGKGRTLAAIIFDNARQGRRRACWLSASATLMDAAAADLAALGAPIPVRQLNATSADATLADEDGVIFATYASLISRSRAGRRRLDQLVEWLGEEPVLVLDEAHKAKNAVGSGEDEGTQTGQCLVELQTRIPGARVVYSSATAATEVRNLAYCTRLGLWGEGTAFPQGFPDFMAEVASGGIASLELVSRDMKAVGAMHAAQISYAGVAHREVTHTLTDAQRRTYDVAAAAWQLVLRRFDEAIAVTNAGKSATGRAKRAFWAAELRFFKTLLTAMKIPTLLRELGDVLAAGCSAIVSLVGTGEAQTRAEVARALAAGDDLDSLNFAPDKIIKELVVRCFPTQQFVDTTDTRTGALTHVPLEDADGNPVQSAEALRMRDELLAELDRLVLPENPLDQIVDSIGADTVAELTGRTKRLVRSSTGVEYRKRVDGVSAARINEHEMRAFQSGRKRVAVISNAASVGVSLHASRAVANQQRRIFFTLEVGWSADVELQRLGRAHRSNQALPPEYVFVTTELGGERRFVSTIAKRLQSLGAITRGHRDAAGVGDLGDYNFESAYGEAALAKLFTLMERKHTRPGLGDPWQVLRDIGLVDADPTTTCRVDDKDRQNVVRFLNRVLALETERQQAFYAWFFDLYAEAVGHAKDAGTFDTGVADIVGERVEILGTPETIHVDSVTQAETRHVVLAVRERARTVPFDEMAAWRDAGLPEIREPGYFAVRKRSDTVVCVFPWRASTNEETGAVTRTCKILQPTGFNPYVLRANEAEERYVRIDDEEARARWALTLASGAGVREREVHILSGAVLPLWKELQTASGSSDRLNIVRVEPSNGPRIVGVELAKGSVLALRRAFGHDTATSADAATIFAELESGGRTIDLVSGLQIRTTRLSGVRAFEVVGAAPDHYAALRAIGLHNEQIAWRQRFFVPTDPESGRTILERLLAKFPLAA